MEQGRTQDNAEDGNVLVRLLSSDGKIFEVPKAVVLQSGILTKAIGDMGIAEPIPLFDVSRKILEKIIEYCTYHIDHAPRPMETIDDIDPWDVQFLEIDRETLSEIAMATHFLDIPSLSLLVCRKIAEIIKSCETPERVRETLRIPNDLPPEVEKDIRNRYQWAFGNEN